MKNKVLYILGGLGLLGLLYWLQNKKKLETSANNPIATPGKAIKYESELIPGTGPDNPDIQPAYQSLFYTVGASKEAITWGSNGKVVVGVPAVYGDTFFVGDSIILNIGVVGPYKQPGKVLSKGKGTRTYLGETQDFNYLYTDITHDGTAGDRKIKVFKLS
ncbi:MAG: hypothetical protein NTZ69_09915 [Bacteroidia bacterium]|nr:hypothetical protein [Bacteroidia bacterium]